MLWVRTRAAETFGVLSSNSTSIDWRNRQIRRGRKVRMSVTINLGGGVSSSSSRTLRAP